MIPCPRLVGPAFHRLLLVAMACTAVLRLHGASTRGPLRAGAAVVDISPTEYPVRVNAMFTERTASKTVDPLEVRALVLDDGTTRLAIAVVDSCMVSRDLLDDAKERASRETGIPTSRMLVSSTHTHSAPSAMGCLGSRIDPRYAAMLPSRIARSIIDAVSRLEPARVAWASVDDWDHTFNRRWIRRPDRLLTDPFGQPSVRAHMHPGHESPDVTGPSGPVDPGLSVLAVQTREGRPLALLANYSQHYYDSPLLSSDYYGRFRRHIAELLGADDHFVGIISQGTSGDLMWMDYGAPRREIGYDAYAREIAERVAGALKGARWIDRVPLAMSERTLTLRFRVPDEKRLAWARELAAKIGERLPQTQPEIYALEAIHLHERPQAELKLQALRIGELGIAAIPNEVFALTGLKLKAQSPLPVTFNVELANGAEGYIPPPEQHRLGGYTTWPARTAGLEEQAEPRIVETLLSLLEEVSGKRRRPMKATDGPAASFLLKQRPVAYWRLEEAAGTVLRDATGQRHDATIQGGAALYLPGIGSGDGFAGGAHLTASPFSGTAINRCIHLAGGHLQCAGLSMGSSFTVGGWFWNGLTNSARGVTGVLLEAGGVSVEIGGTNAVRGVLAIRGSDGKLKGQGTTDLGLRAWRHVALVRRGLVLEVYLDGNLEIRNVVAPEVWNREVRFGGRAGSGDTLEGKLDELSVFDRALGLPELVKLARIGANGAGLGIGQASR